MKTSTKLFFVCLCLIVTKNLSAQEKITELDSLTVTATIIGSKQKETGRNITVIQGDLFNKLPVSSIDELLRYLPGIEVQQRGAQGSQSDIIIRGGTFQQVLVIIDGLKLNDPLTGHFNSYIPIHPGEIERIEILKGASSALYGSEAVGGVVHIITKTFSSALKNKKELNAGLRFGENKLLNVNGNFRYSINNSTIAVGILSNHSDGHQLRGTNGFFDNTTTSIAFSQKLKKDWQINFRTAADFRNFNAQNFYTTFLSDTAKEKVTSFWQHAAVSKTTVKYSLTFDAGYKKLTDEFSFRPASVPNNNKTNLISSQVNYSRKLNPNHSIVSGLQFQQKRIISNDRGNHSLLHGAAFIIGKHKLGENFHINESLRADWDENYGLVLIPQLNIAWAVSKFIVRASAGKSIRDADFTERYNNYNKVLVTGGSIGNPELIAEKSFNAEIGFDYTVSSFFKINSTFFYRKQNQLIDWTPTPYSEIPRKINLVPTGNYAFAKNIAEVNTTGFEFDLVYKKQFSNSVNLYSTAGFVFLNTKSDNSIPSFYISSHAKQLFNFNTILTLKAFNISFNGIYKKRNKQNATAINATITPSYFILNGKLGYTFLKGKLQFYFETDNIFNTRYSDLLGSKMPGSWLSGGFQIAL